MLYFYNLIYITFNSNILFHSNFPTFVYKSGIFFSPDLAYICLKVSHLIATFSWRKVRTPKGSIADNIRRLSADRKDQCNRKNVQFGCSEIR